MNNRKKEPEKIKLLLQSEDNSVLVASEKWQVASEEGRIKQKQKKRLKQAAF